jgi:hypothetical protein
MPSKPRREGLLTIDHRNSPGVSAEFVRASGLSAPVVRAGQVFESATVTCAHCNVVVVLNPDRTRPRGYCRTTLGLLNLSFNAFGGIVRWAAPDEHGVLRMLGNTASLGELSLSAYTGGTPGLMGAHIIYEPI